MEYKQDRKLTIKLKNTKNDKIYIMIDIFAAIIIKFENTKNDIPNSIR